MRRVSRSNKCANARFWQCVKRKYGDVGGIVFVDGWKVRVYKIQQERYRGSWGGKPCAMTSN